MDFEVILTNGIRIIIIGAVMFLFFSIIVTTLLVLRVQVQSNGIKLGNLMGIAAFLLMAPIVIAFYPAVILGSVDQSIDNSKASADSITTKLTGWFSEAFTVESSGAYAPQPAIAPTPIMSAEERSAANGIVITSDQTTIVTSTPQIDTNAGGGVPEESLNTAVPLPTATKVVARATAIPKVMTLQPTPTLAPTATPLANLSDWQPGMNPTPTN